MDAQRSEWKPLQSCVMSEFNKQRASKSLWRTTGIMHCLEQVNPICPYGQRTLTTCRCTGAKGQLATKLPSKRSAIIKPKSFTWRRSTQEHVVFSTTGKTENTEEANVYFYLFFFGGSCTKLMKIKFRKLLWLSWILGDALFNFFLSKNIENIYGDAAEIIGSKC